MNNFFAENKLIKGESCCFINENFCNLLFPIKDIVKVYNPTLGIEFQKDIDFSFQNGDNKIHLLSGSRIAMFSYLDMNPEEDLILFPAPNANAISGGINNSHLRFNNENYFAQIQILVDYIPEKTDIFIEESNNKDIRLLETKSKLLNSKNIIINVLGDSITEGYNATKFVKSEPFKSPYIEQFQAFLSNKYQTEVVINNFAIAGASIISAKQLREKYMNNLADLTIIAYGMNDYSRLTPTEFINEIDAVVEDIRSIQANMEFILVSSMSGNSSWIHTPVGKDIQFSEMLRNYIQNKTYIDLADVNKIWHIIEERKGFYSLTGNGVNHPNDFGHYIYSKVLESKL